MKEVLVFLGNFLITNKIVENNSNQKMFIIFSLKTLRSSTRDTNLCGIPQRYEKN